MAVPSGAQESIWDAGSIPGQPSARQTPYLLCVSCSSPRKSFSRSFNHRLIFVNLVLPVLSTLFPHFLSQSSAPRHSSHTYTLFFPRLFPKYSHFHISLCNCFTARNKVVCACVTTLLPPQERKERNGIPLVSCFILFCFNILIYLLLSNPVLGSGSYTGRMTEMAAS